MPPSDSSKDASSVQADSITKQDLGVVKNLQADVPNGDPGLAPKEENTVLQKLQKWADYDSYGEPVLPTRFIPMKTPMSSEIVSNWSLEEPPKHVLTIPSLLREESARGREIGLIIDLSNHETLYAEDLAAANNVEYAHIQLVAKMFPGKASIIQVIKTARTFWDRHPNQYIAIHCAYGFNRTGFVVCAYLILVCGLSVQEALANFAAARPPGVKHEKFVVELYRRYGARRVSMSHPIPVQQGSTAGPDGPSRAAGQPAGASPDSVVAGRSPDSDVSASQHSTHSGSVRLVRLYPDEDLTALPLEPGTPSTESTVATQQLWDALSRGRASAYRVRAASELSVAGSEMGGRLSEDDAGYSMDGRFSCSSLYSEFGHVASHLEERHPGLVLARTSMKQLPPRSVTSETSAISDLPAGRSAEDVPHLLAQQHSQAARPAGDPAAARPERPAADAGAELAGRLPGDRGDAGSARSSRDPTRHGQQQLASWVENDAERPLSQSVSSSRLRGRGVAEPPVGLASPAGSSHVHLNGRHSHPAEELSVQQTSNSNSSLGGGSACSLVNNESLGLDERGIFEHLGTKDRSKEGRAGRGRRARSGSKLTLQDICSGAASQAPASGGHAEQPMAALSGAHSELAALADTPFASATAQGPVHESAASAAAAAASGKRGGKAARKLFTRQSQREQRSRCSLM